MFTKQRSRRGPLKTEPEGDEGKIVRMFNAEQAVLREEQAGGVPVATDRSN
jgi:hypothetical protein